MKYVNFFPLHEGMTRGSSSLSAEAEAFEMHDITNLTRRYPPEKSRSPPPLPPIHQAEDRNVFEMYANKNAIHFVYAAAKC